MSIVKSAATVVATGMLCAATALAQTSTPSPPAAPPSGDVKQKQQQGAAPATPAQRTQGVSDPAAKEQAGKPSTPATSESKPADRMSADKDRMGMTASPEQVRQVQQALKDKGKDPGPIDGVMGPQTKSALKDYQQDEGLKATGQLDTATLAKLGVSDSSSPSAAPRPPSSMDTEKEKRGGDTQSTPQGRRKQNP